MKRVINYIVNAIKWAVFSFISAYAGTRVSNFLDDPYMEGHYEGRVVEQFGILAVQAIGFMVIGALLFSLYKIFFKPNDVKEENFVTLFIAICIISIGLFS